MKILNARVRWNTGLANDPRLEVLVDKMPPMADLRYEQKDGCYFAQKEGFVSFFYYTGPGEGFGGSTFKIKLADGTDKDLIGPWSSRSGVMNRHFPQSLEVSITEDAGSFARGWTLFASALLVDTAKEALEKFVPEATIIKEEPRMCGDPDICYVVVLKDGRRKPLRAPGDPKENKWR